MTPRIRRQDFGVLTPPALGEWEPTLRVTVVIPAHDRQETLDLTLAALAGQSYPAELLDVIVVDDGSSPPLRLPDVRPARSTLISSPPDGWGRAWALQAGIDAAAGDVILVLDADMVPHRTHVEAQLRWHHLAPYLVVLGWIDFTPGDVLPAPAEVRQALEAGTEDKLFPLSPHRHDWAEKIISEHDGLRTAPNSLATRIHVGATASYPAALLRAIGGLDTSLVLAEDTELGYRLTQAGAVFVPDPESRAWHLGLPTAMREFAALKRYNDPFVADRVPYRRYLRMDAGRQWLVPYVHAVVGGASYEDVRATVDGLLGSSLPDIAVTIEAGWDSLGSSRRAPLTDPELDLRLVRATFEHDPRVRLAASEPASPAPFRLLMPPGWVPGHDTLERLVAHLEEHDLGAVFVALDEGQGGVVVARLERTAALARVALVARPGERYDDVLDEVFGLEWVDGETWGFARRPGVYPPRRRPVPEAERLRAQHDKELRRVRRRLAALQAEVAQLRREAGKGRRDAQRWREKAESWRREAVGLARAKDRTVLERAVRRVRALIVKP
ncbi:glycosyltransferase family 2 protein [Nonomuraea sediminis]|uniref:glycosyltransferase family 2 protein n=1 Tax=Nonomuraea sediminis TaxID=2835864 RepID=UPI001BDD6F57|nr:glycosyltransferase family 2 protein [Nonomuraea sediminis]